MRGNMGERVLDPKKVQEYYDKVYAEKLKKTPAWKYTKGHRDSVLLAYIKKITPQKILEVGVGEGHFAFKVSKQNPEISYVGIDISSEAIRIADEGIKNQNFRFLIANGICLPFESNKFDLVICSEVIEHIKEKRKLLFEIGRVLKSGGHLALTTPNPKSLTYMVPRVIQKVMRFEYGSHQPVEAQLEPIEVTGMLKNTHFSLINYKGLVFEPYALGMLERLIGRSLMPIRRISEYFERKNIFQFVALYQVILARNEMSALTF